MGGDVFRDEFSLAFDGTDEYLDCGDKSDWNFSNGSASIFSLSLWYKCTDTSPDTFDSLMGKNDTGANKKEWRLSVDGNDKIVFTTSGDGTAVITNTSTFVVDDTEWHHVVVTYDGSVGTANLRCKIYVDGNDVMATGNTNNVAVLNEDDANLTIGGFLNSGSPSSLWHGNISDVAIYNSALTISQVKTIYNGREPYNHKEGVASNNLKAWWRMGDGVLDTQQTQHEYTGIVCDETNATLGSDLLGGEGNFSDPSYWNISAGHSVVEDNVGKFLGSGTYGQINRASIFTTGKMYRADIDCTSNAGTTVQVNQGDPYPMLVPQGQTGRFHCYFLAKQTYITLYAPTGTYSNAATVDNFLIREVGGNPAALQNYDTTNRFEGDTP